MGLEKREPLCSMFGPLVYNLYSNDLLYLVCGLCNIYNYADDNTICVHGNKIENVLLDIELVSNVLMNWFKENVLQANPEKFQFILFSKTNLENSILVDNISLMPQSNC